MTIKQHLENLLGILLCLTTLSGAEGQKLVKSEPADQARNVTADIQVIRLHFDRDMKMNSWTVCLPRTGTFPPPTADNTAPWKSPRVFELRVKKLAPDTIYALQLNSDKKKGFQTADDRRPLPVTVVSFRTAPVEKVPDQSIGVEPEENENTPDRTIGGETEEGETGRCNGGRNGKPVTLKLSSREEEPGAGTPCMGMARGWRFQTSRTTLLDLVARQAGQRYPIKALVQVKFDEEVTRAAGGKALEATREISLAQVRTRDPESGKNIQNTLSEKGKVYRVRFGRDCGEVTDAGTGSPVGEELSDVLGDSLAPALWPEGDLKKGQSWTYRDGEVTRRLRFANASGGKLYLRVKKIVTNEETGLRVIQIRGKLQTRVQLESMLLNYRASVEIDLPEAINVPLMVHLEGRMSASGSEQNEWGERVSYKISGSAEYYQVATPSRNTVKESRSAGASPATVPAPRG